MRNLTTRRVSIVGIAAAAALTLTLGACGGSSTPKSAPGSTTPATTPRSGTKIVLASIRTTGAAHTARIATTVAIDGSGSAFTTTSNGAIDFSTGNSDIVTDLGAASAPRLGQMEQRSVGGVLYVKVPNGLPQPFGAKTGKPWISLKGFGGAAGNDGLIPGMGQTDPAQFLAALSQVSNDVKAVGTAGVRGVETTHYTATIDFAKAIDKSGLPAAFRADTKDLFGNVPPFPVDVFVDHDGFLRREVLHVDLAKLTAGLGASGVGGSLPTMTETVDLYDFGSAVDVEAPPADQVMTLKDLMQGIVGENGGGTLGGLGGMPAAAPPTKVS